MPASICCVWGPMSCLCCSIPDCAVHSHLLCSTLHFALLNSQVWPGGSWHLLAFGFNSQHIFWLSLARRKTAPTTVFVSVCLLQILSGARCTSTVPGRNPGVRRWVLCAWVLSFMLEFASGGAHLSGILCFCCDLSDLHSWCPPPPEPHSHSANLSFLTVAAHLPGVRRRRRDVT